MLSEHHFEGFSELTKMITKQFVEISKGINACEVRATQSRGVRFLLIPDCHRCLLCHTGRVARKGLCRCC